MTYFNWNQFDNLIFDAKINKDKEMNPKKNIKKVTTYSEFDASMINIVKDDSELDLFKDLSTSKKLTLLNLYCKEKELPDEIIEILVTLVSKGHLKNKCDIDYDNVNMKICNINILKYDSKNNCYKISKKK